MHEAEPSRSQADIDRAFNDMIGDFSLEERQAPSIDAQQETLAAIQHQHHQALQESGIMTVVVDKMPESFIGNEPEVSLRRVMRRQSQGSDITEAYISVGCWQQKPDGSKAWHPMSISVAQAQDGVITPMNGFEPEQAALAIQQINELAVLKDQGILPNLSAGLDSVVDPRNGLVLRKQ